MTAGFRTTFIVEPAGVVACVIPKVTPRTHDDEVLVVLEQLAAAKRAAAVTGHGLANGGVL